jgi:hypothetical protein
MAAKITARWTFLWLLLLATFVYQAAKTGAFHQVSTYIGITVGVAIVTVAYAVGRRRNLRGDRHGEH